MEGTRGILAPSAARAHFRLRRMRPDPSLADHVDRHWVVDWELDGDEAFVQRILPHPCVNLAAEPGLVAVWGIPLSISPHRLEGRGTAIGTKFHPGGFAGFHDGSASLLNDRIVPLGELFGAAGDRLARELRDAAGDAEAHIAAVERFLHARRPPPDPRYALVRAVVRGMLDAEPGTTVAALADRHAVSPRTLQRLFRDHVGVGPKWVLKRYRMHVAADRIASEEAGDVAALALELGYFDQSHFTRDFTAQIGMAPVAYARMCAQAAASASG